MYPNADPWNWLVPDLVTALIRPPTNPPCRTSNGATRTWYSFTASIESGRAFTPPPGTWLLALSANRSLLLVPSIWMLLNRSFCPVIDVPPPGVFTIWGDVLTKSLNARFSVGSRRSAESEMRSEEHTSELQSRSDLVCRLLLEKKKKISTGADSVTAVGGFSVGVRPSGGLTARPSSPAGAGAGAAAFAVAAVFVPVSGRGAAVC